MITAVVVVAAGGRREAVRSGPARTTAAEEWWPGWPAQYAYQHVGPPYPVRRGLGAPGSRPRRRQSAQ